MERKPKIGDRYYNTYGLGTWEVTGPNNRYNQNPSVRVDPGVTGHLYNDTEPWAFRNNAVWEYLGNFSKSNQFKTIYQILNDEDISRM